MNSAAASGGLMEAGQGCLQFQSLLPGYLEGENHAQIPAHAAQCEFCRCLLLDLESIRSAGSELAEAHEPPAMMWDAIRSSLAREGIIREPHPTAARSDIRPRQPRRLTSRWGRWNWLGALGYPAPLAAGVVAALIAVALFKTPGFLVHPSHSMAASYPIHAAAFLQGSAAPHDTTALRQTVSEMEQTYRANQASLAPAMRATYDKSLDSLNDEIRECQASMKQEPENRLAQDYLSNAYAEKIQLLQTALEDNQ